MEGEARFAQSRIVASATSSAPCGELARTLVPARLRARRDLVGVQGPLPGSGRPDGEFWELGGWFIKTNAGRCHRSLPEAEHQLVTLATVKRRLGSLVPEPSHLFVSNDPDGAFRVWTMAPILVTARERFGAAATAALWDDFGRQLVAWVEALIASLARSVDDALCLDANPSNFATQDGSLRYIDDDVLERRDAWGIEDGLLARISEYPETPEEVIRTYLRTFVRRLEESALIFRWHELELPQRLLQAARLRRRTETWAQDLVQCVSSRRSKLGVAPL